MSGDKACTELWLSTSPNISPKKVRERFKEEKDNIDRTNDDARTQGKKVEEMENDRGKGMQRRVQKKCGESEVMSQEKEVGSAVLR